MAPDNKEFSERTFEREVMPHVDVAYRMAYSLTRDDDRASDLVQDAILRALRAFPRLRHTDNLRSWLARIVHTTFLDGVRYEDRRAADSLEDIPAALRDRETYEMFPEVFENALDDDYLEVLSELPPQWRATIQLVDVEGMSYQEAAEALDLPLGTVRSQLHRARKLFHDLLCLRLRLSLCPEQD